MDNSDFVPKASSTVSRNKTKKRLLQNFQTSQFADEQSMFSTSSSIRDNTIPESSYQLEEQRQLARTSLMRANKVAGIPSKYFHPNFSKSDSNISNFNESTVSESDLLQIPKSSSTHLNSTNSKSQLVDSLDQLSFKFIDGNFNIDNLMNDCKKVFHNEKERSSMFKPAEEACSMLRADEMSWKQKHEMPIQVEQFSEYNITGKESLGAFFQQKCNTLSDFLNSESPNVSKEPIALIEPSFSLVEDKICENNENQSLSISIIQKALMSDSPKSAVENLLKFKSKSELLPPSKNSSYTSDHSENEALQVICNKKDVTKNTSPSSRTSSRASSALTSLQNDKLPVESTKAELVWGCVKIGKSTTQEFMLRNRSAKKLCLQLSLGSQEFKIRKDNRSDSEPLSSIKIILHAHESRVVIVSFIPTKIGAAVDELYFTSLDPNLKQTKKQCIKLFGYGGSYKVEFNDLTRDTAGKFWLSFGKLDDRRIITSNFQVKNKGEIPVFIQISINSAENSKLDVNPNFFVLTAQEQKDIKVSFKPSNEDYSFLHKSLHATMIVDLGSLNVIYGAEVDRGRLRKICEKCVEKGLKVCSNVKILLEKIEGETMPIDLVKFKEPPSHLKEITKLLNHHQIILTLERDPEQTMIQQFSDDSGLYHSLYQESTLNSTKTGVDHFCYVAPKMLILTLPYKHKDTIFLKSDNQHKLNFIVKCQQPDLVLKPKEGVLEPNTTVTISVKYTSSTLSETKHFKVLIIVEAQIFEVDVTVDSIGQVKNKNKSLLNCIL